MAGKPRAPLRFKVALFLGGFKTAEGHIAGFQPQRLLGEEMARRIESRVMAKVILLHLELRIVDWDLCLPAIHHYLVVLIPVGHHSKKSLS